MKVRALFFAQLKDAFGESERMIETQHGVTIDELVGLLMNDTCARNWKHLPFRYAVNEKFEDGRTELRDGDTLALVPPVSGG